MTRSGTARGTTTSPSSASRRCSTHGLTPRRSRRRCSTTERRNLALFGYGVKGFTLSMIETALTLSGAPDRRAPRIERDHRHRARSCWPTRSSCSTGSPRRLDVLSAHHRLVLITKGDLFHQESKVAASGVRRAVRGHRDRGREGRRHLLADLARLGPTPAGFCMVGNSVRSDIAPVLELGGAGVHVPYHVTWALEHAEIEEAHPRLARVAGFRRGPGCDRRAGAGAHERRLGRAPPRGGGDDASAPTPPTPASWWARRAGRRRPPGARVQRRERQLRRDASAPSAGWSPTWPPRAAAGSWRWRSSPATGGRWRPAAAAGSCCTSTAAPSC